MTEPGRDHPYDPGLQPERTLLAWRRTALALAVLSAGGVRLTAGTLGWAALVLGGAGTVLGLLAYAVTGTRYRQVSRHLLDTDEHLGDGWPQLLLSLAGLVCGATALGYVLAGR